MFVHSGVVLASWRPNTASRARGTALRSKAVVSLQLGRGKGASLWLTTRNPKPDCFGGKGLSQGFKIKAEGCKVWGFGMFWVLRP